MVYFSYCNFDEVATALPSIFFKNIIKSPIYVSDAVHLKPLTCPCDCTRLPGVTFVSGAQFEHFACTLVIKIMLTCLCLARRKVLGILSLTLTGRKEILE